MARLRTCLISCIRTTQFILDSRAAKYTAERDQKTGRDPNLERSSFDFGNGPTIMSHMLSVAGAEITCALFGHKVDHTRIVSEAGARCARCLAAILGLRDNFSRIAHVLYCFFGKHHYLRVGTRASHHEYICERCGHSLLLDSMRDPYAGLERLKKRVSYACGLFGHRVHVVSTELKAIEYACKCGHPFIKPQRELTVIRHPLPCIFRGHVLALSAIRDAWVEYVCGRCGHPFYFRLTIPDQVGARSQGLS
jgi:DNA-directed RNA polymerase subunit RPC12/RpoP